MKHLYISVSLGLLALSFVFMTSVFADSSDSMSTESMMIGTVGTGSSGMNYQQHHQDKLNMIDTIRQNWKDTIDKSASGNKALLDMSDKIRQEATAACKVAVDQFKAGVITRDVAFTQCKELKTKMEDTVKTMRRDLQVARKANRESTKEKNQGMRKDVRQQYSTGMVGSGDMKPPRKEDYIGTGSTGMRDTSKGIEDILKRPEIKMSTGDIVGTGDMRPPRLGTGDTLMLGDTDARGEMDNRPNIIPTRDETIKSKNTVDWIPPA